MMSLGRYALMGTASQMELEVEVVPRRPLIAPGTKALTREQAAERRAARAAQAQHADAQRQLGEALRQRGWLQAAIARKPGDPGAWRHPSGASLPDLELGDKTVDSVLRVADGRVRVAEESRPVVDLRATLASRGWRANELLGGNILRHEPSGAVITYFELMQNTPEAVLQMAEQRVATALHQAVVGQQFIPIHLSPHPGSQMWGVASASHSHGYGVYRTGSGG